MKNRFRLLSRGLAVVVAAAGLAALVAGGASGAPGDLIADLTIADSAGGVSVAFDGVKLYYTNFSGTTLHSINTDGATGHVDVAITDSATGGPVGIDAFSFDATRGVFWGASGTAIYQITTAGSATFQFDVAANLVGDCDNGGFGCLSLVDGLAYDASDDSIWYSPDASQRIYHFLVPGGAPAPTAFIDVNDPPNDMLAECGFNYSSGVAAGLSVLYLGADGCPNYFQYDKLGTKLASFPYTGERAEDFECDNVTFGVDVMWVRDAFDGHIRAFEVPAGTCEFGGGGGGIRFMTGGGSVFTSTGVRVTHGFELNCDSSQTPNNLQINWGKGNRFHLTSLTRASCSDDPTISPDPPGADFDTYVGAGTGKYNGVPGATAEWTFTDAGEPGTSDTADIVIMDASNIVVLTVSGTLTNGNHQAHSG